MHTLTELANPTPTTAVPWGPIGKDVFERSYSRHLYLRDAVTGDPIRDDNGNLIPFDWATPELLALGGGLQETWLQTVTRVASANLAAVDPNSWDDNEQQELVNHMFHMRAVPAGRHLWATGTPLSATRNCFRVSFSERNADHYVRLFNLLMLGGGVGANYSDEYLARCRPISGTLDVIFACRTDHPDIDKFEAHVDNQAANEVRESGDDHIWFTIPDSREGWCEAVGLVFDTAEQPGEHTIVFDVSDVRPYGAPLITFGGSASGPEPLVESLAGASALINKCTGDRVDWLSAMRIVHMLSATVVAGGTRRSARMSMKNWADVGIFDFINVKSELADMWTTNISVEIDDAYFAALNSPSHELHTHANAVTEAVCNAMVVNGEPGFYNSALAQIGEPGDVRCTNPCGEIGLEEGNPELGENSSAGEACNLAHVNLAHYANDHEGAKRAFALMARLTLRATCVELADPEVGQIEGRNRRIGVGFFGFAEWLAKMGVRYSDAATNPEVARRLNDYRIAARAAADQLADDLGIPRPVKVTTVAPTGTIAQLSGTSTGMQAIFARYFLRRVRHQDNDPNLADLLGRGLNIIDSPTEKNTVVVEHPVREALLDRVDESLVESEDEIDSGTMLAVQAMVQNTYCAGADGNSISFTVNLGEGVTADQLSAAMRKHLPNLKGTTVLPAFTDEMAQAMLAPLQRISKEQFETLEGGSTGNAEVDCATGACPIR